MEALTEPGRLHRAATILDDQALHDLTNNDVFWDKVVEITSSGEQEAFSVTVANADNVVVQGISVLTNRSDTLF